MPKLDRYLFSDFFQSVVATTIVLFVVGGGGVLVNVLGSIADGRFPACLLLKEFGLQLIVYLPLLLPLALLLGLLLSLARLYRDSEMSVLAAIGVGPLRLLPPILAIVIPVTLSVALCSLWLAPWAKRTANALIIEASQTMLIDGLDAGEFTTLPGEHGGIIYVTSISQNGSQMRGVFLQREEKGRTVLITAASGALHLRGKEQRFLRLDHGTRIDAPVGLVSQRYQSMHFSQGDIALANRPIEQDSNDPELLSTQQLLNDHRLQAQSQLHRRIAPPCLAFAFGLLALPFARSAPRQQRYGRLLISFLVYVVANNVMIVGSQWISTGKLAPQWGLWWMTGPLIVAAIWSYGRDGRMRPLKGAK